MNKKNIYGIVSIIAGVFLFLPLVFYYGAVVFKADGVNINSAIKLLYTTFGMKAPDFGVTFFQSIEHLGDTGLTIWDTLTAVFAIITIVAAVGLIIYGILLLTLKNKKLVKLSNIVTIAVGSIAFLTALFAFLSVVTEKPLVDEYFSTAIGQPVTIYAVLGFGTIFLLLTSIAAIVWGSLMHLVKDGAPAKKVAASGKPAESKPAAANKSVASKPATAANKSAATAKKPAAPKKTVAKK